MAGIKMTHVPYKGSAPAEVDLMAGTVDIMFDNLASALPAYNGKKVRILAVGSPQRAALLPDIPTLRELGLSDFQAVTWFAVVAPAKTPLAIRNNINETTNAVLQMPDVKEKFLQQGAQPFGGTIADMARFVADETKRWGVVIKDAHISIVE
jgi:tripartite-type tricarboxylate transporter receptor subunit TctC